MMGMKRILNDIDEVLLYTLINDIVTSECNTVLEDNRSVRRLLHGRGYSWEKARDEHLGGRVECGL
jgi:transposase